ncbi:CRISPR-associated protein Cas2 [Staphylococcus piscifermentans]|uniref:CRISPR-associated endonuclease Cas2 n=1 Tax=Staphylococcus piscifermentans TaxID=70258 RepID=UPI000B94C47E|nr:CRISPR-associated endonuclease Cas2 [Staphylococcus piscifermentans]RTX83951.1 CRISPR-associated endonuclease Cas2 [Staphylococcus piscifermentans]SNV05761.1 CRISPR-associated protein Cas2 [Staphylococcus piscifermentans]
MRFLRLFIMFDLPVETSRERRDYRKFVKFLLNEGYVRSQYSIYCKLILNRGTLNHQLSKLKQNLPSNGIVQTLIVTEKQFSDMTYLVGEPSTKYDVNTTERMLEL